MKLYSDIRVHLDILDNEATGDDYQRPFVRAFAEKCVELRETYPKLSEEFTLVWDGNEFVVRSKYGRIKIQCWAPNTQNMAADVQVLSDKIRNILRIKNR